MKYLYIYLLLFLLLEACSQKMYFPDRVNAPNLREAMEGKATFSAKFQMKPTDTVTNVQNVNMGLGGDIAFSPVKHLGLIASYRRILNKEIRDESTGAFSNDAELEGLYNGSRWELGAGYYDNFSDKGTVEVYAGYGAGSLRRSGVQPNVSYYTRYQRYFIQPAIGFTKDDFFSMSFGGRLAIMKFHEFESPNSNLRFEMFDEGWDVTSNIFAYLEPFVNIEGGYKYAKANLQFGFSTPLGSGGFAVSPYVSIGLQFHFKRRFFK